MYDKFLYDGLLSPIYRRLTAIMPCRIKHSDVGEKLYDYLQRQVLPMEEGNKRIIDMRV